MGLTGIQGALARLYTDSALRDRLRTDPQGVVAELGLSPGEAAVVTHLPASQVHFFAASLVDKRRREVEKLLPVTRHLLGRRFHDCFEHYAVTPIPEAVQRHRADALAFGTFLKECDLLFDPPWSMDVLRYEIAWLEAASSQQRWLFRRFRYPVGSIVRGVGENPAATVPPQTTYGGWFRMGRDRPLRHILLPPGR